MNYKNNTKTILFASLIAAMILPFSVMDVANAAPNEKAKEKSSVLEDKKNWLKLFKEDKLNTMSKAEQDRYLQLLTQFLETRNTHQIELDQELEKLSLIVLDSKAKGENFEDKHEFKEQVKKIKQLDNTRC